MISHGFRRFFGIAPSEVRWEKRGFHRGSEEARGRLEGICDVFLSGYHASLETSQTAALSARLEAQADETRGFAYEGAAMGLALRDWLTPWRRERVTEFLKGPAGAHAYMVHVGAGWVLARAPVNVDRFLSRFDPLLRWLVVDGYGFHEGFFNWQRYRNGAGLPARLKNYARRAFDQGLGRSLWFVEGAEVGRIPDAIEGLTEHSRPDLWSGVGLAAVYAGEASVESLQRLGESAGECQAQLAQGAVFAAKARHRAGNATEYTETATRVLSGLSVTEAARLCDEALENVEDTEREPAYEVWRRRAQQRLVQIFELKRVLDVKRPITHEGGELDGALGGRPGSEESAALKRAVAEGLTMTTAKTPSVFLGTSFCTNP